MRSTTFAALVVSLAFALGLALPSSADAQARRPLYAGFGVGPYAYFDVDNVHFRGEGEFGWHPSGTTEGFFLAANATTSVGRNFVLFFGGIRLGGDIAVHRTRDVTIFLRPSGLFAAGFLDFDGRDNTYGGFMLQPAFDLKIALLDELLHIVLRPIAIDIFLWPDYRFGGRRDFSASFAYSGLVGLHFAF